MFQNYGWNALRKDLIAGLTVAAIAVPQSMAYALIAGIDPRFGLYSAIIVTALASILGSSSHLINGPTNAISLVVFSALASFDPDARAEAYEATFLLGIMVGIIQIGIALFKWGDLTRYISESVVLGFMAGAGLLVGLSQVGNLFGIQDKGTGHQHLLHRLWLTLTSGDALNPRALGIGLGTVVVVLVMRKLIRKYQLPRIDMLTAVVVAAALTAVLGWSEPGANGKSLVSVVGRVPAGLPAFHVPEIKFEWVPNMAGSAFAIAFLGLLEALAIAKSIANQTRQPLDYNQQCLAEGLANLGGGLFQCLPGSGSLTRSAINFQAGAVSRFSGVVAAVAVALVVILLAPLARFIPKSALAGLLLITAAGLIDRKRLLYTLRASGFDALLVVATAFTAVFVSVEFAILVGTALSVLLYVPRAARLKATELTVTPERVVRGRLPSDPVADDVILFDLEGELFFGAIRELDRYLDDLKARALAGARVIVLRVKRTRNPDVVCMERLEHFLHEMKEHDVIVLLCGVREDFSQSMKNLRFYEWLPLDRIFPQTDARDSATLEAVRYAYELLGHEDREPKQAELYYLV
jgi:sulfate permease, SulP family